MLIVWHTDRLCMLVISLQFTGIAGRCLECFIGSIAVQIKLVRINRTEIKLIQIFAIVLLCRTFYIPFIMFICAFPVFLFSPGRLSSVLKLASNFIVTAIRSNANQVYINRGVLYITTEILKFYCILRRKYNCFHSYIGLTDKSRQPVFTSYILARSSRRGRISPHASGVRHCSATCPSS